MAKISSLDPAEAMTGHETVPIVQDNETRQVPLLDLLSAPQAADVIMLGDNTLNEAVDEAGAKGLYALDQLNFRLSQVGGVTGLVLMDEIGNAFGFLPVDAGTLRLKHLEANETSLHAGPLSVRLISGGRGMVFLDEVGNAVPLGLMEAPTDGAAYMRKDGEWSAAHDLPEAPADDIAYVRKNEAWEAAPALDLGAVNNLASRSRRVVTFGHSKCDYNSANGASNVYNPNGGTARKCQLGWLAFADYYLRGGIDWAWNAGVGGESDAQMLARIEADVIAKEPAWVLMLGGTCNSIAGGKTAAEIITTQLGTQTADSGSSILGVLQRHGIRTLWMTDPTWHTDHEGLTNANFATLARVNRALLRAPGYKTGLDVLDANAFIIDPASPTGSAKANVLRDGIHFSQRGARAIGKALAAKMKALGFPDWDSLIASAADRYGLDNSSRQLFDNPMLLLDVEDVPDGINSGSTTVSTSGDNGGIPAGCRITRTGTWGAGYIQSKVVPRADGFGNDWIVTVTNTGAAGDTVQLIFQNGENGFRDRLSTGDVVEAAAQVDVTGMNLVREHCLLSNLSNGTVFPVIATMERDRNDPVAQFDQADLVGGVMRTGKASVPSGTLSSSSGDSRLRVVFDGAGGTAVIRVSRVQYLKNS